MQKRRLGNSDLELTVIGFGTWGISGGNWPFGWGDQDEAEAVAAIVRGVELGINWIDTAPVYGFGRSEELTRKALEQLGSSKRPIIATKCSRVRQADGSVGGCLKAESIIKECEESLKRLNVETIDLYQLHWPMPDEDIEEGWSTVLKLKEQGKVRYIGVSNFNVDQLKRVQKIAPVTSLQPPYNLIQDETEKEILPYCKEQNIGVVCYSPMCKGLLTGAFNKERSQNLTKDDHRSRDPKFQEPQLSINLKFVKGLETIAQEQGRTVAELAIAWTLRNPATTSAIVGARRPGQIEDTVKAGDWVLEDSVMDKIQKLRAIRIEELKSISNK